MRVQDGLVVAIGLAVVLACGARAEAQELGPVIEAIEALHAERLDVLRTLAEASEADAEETPDDSPARAWATLDRGTVDVVAKAHEEKLAKLWEVRREGTWEQAYPLRRPWRPMPPHTRPSVATAQRWPNARAAGGRTREPWPGVRASSSRPASVFFSRSHLASVLDVMKFSSPHMNVQRTWGYRSRYRQL